MAESSKSILLQCGSCESEYIRCMNLKEIIYSHLMELTYSCENCGHSGTIIVDCIVTLGLRVSIQ
ncbi:MAG: hypothetical protein M1129_01715 [Candidatus Thermoplasmatota archaeon]|nr:hypothetical protein [Candidatus Thermoplasmatota archaeon]MCL5954723.1 hypothetical protein [Candidatus Thermoplasmatota archaeon]